MLQTRIVKLCLSVFTGLSLGAFPTRAADSSESFLLAAQREIPWHSYAQGFSQAQQEKKFMVLTFVADWCGYCTKMRETTFADPDVIKATQRWFVPIQVEEKSQKPAVFEGRHIREKELLSAYEVSGFPATVILKPNGEVLTRLFGYIEPREFDALLKFVGTHSYEKMTFVAFKQKFAKFIKKYQ
jgi:thioredoxin-related protein